jgi:hypothetical protein
VLTSRPQPATSRTGRPRAGQVVSQCCGRHVSTVAADEWPAYEQDRSSAATVLTSPCFRILLIIMSPTTQGGGTVTTHRIPQLTLGQSHDKSRRAPGPFYCLAEEDLAQWRAGGGAQGISTSAIKSREQGSGVHPGQDASERLEPARAPTHRARDQPYSGLGPWVQHQLSGLSYSSAPKAAPNGRPRGRNWLDIGAEAFICVRGGGPSTQMHEEGVPARLSFRLSQGKAGRQAGLDSKLTADSQEPRQRATTRFALC